VKTKCTDENQVRMDWLIENDEYDLPDQLRCDSHKKGNTYPAVYGRMYWDKPADTITAGFTSNGQGRFTHPGAFPGRALTPHEAARIQTFPDWFQFLEKDRGVLKKAIGNAVPPLLSMCVVYVAVSAL
jgi:DNA (cytosine-5)-methyltransferase 1